ncbi:hypothetical protein [Litoribaculum gwangyangense]|uniref:Toxin-antitoxin system YwqK family antitoxin n=1 Tax=Litoribaculum gwangyangense TaxID=1130722 RepID=A0ABP9BXL5_9FLAO
MKLIKNKLSVAILFLAVSIFSCKNKSNTDDSNFKLVERNSYFIDNYDGISVYRDNETRKPLNGYYVVGDKFKKWEEFRVENGILNGPSFVFHNNGEVFSETNYLNGKLDGEEKIYSLSGKLKTLNTYKNGVKYGKSLSYYESGELQSESKIENEKVIESISYDIIGKIESQMFIEDGKKITQYIKNGKVFSESISSTYDNFEAVKFYNEDGSLKLFIQMLVDEENAFIIERNENGEEIKRINLKENPEEALKFRALFGEF